MHFTFLLSESELDWRRMNRSFRSQVKVNVAGVGCNNQPVYHQTHGVALHAVCDSELDVPPSLQFHLFLRTILPKCDPHTPAPRPTSRPVTVPTHRIPQYRFRLTSTAPCSPQYQLRSQQSRRGKPQCVLSLSS